MEALTATVQQQQVQHATAAEAQHRQLHAFNLALLEQAEELAALQALLGAPAKKRQSMTSRRRVTEDLMTSLDHLLFQLAQALLPCCVMCELGLHVTYAHGAAGTYAVQNIIMSAINLMHSNIRLCAAKGTAIGRQSILGKVTNGAHAAELLK